MSEATSKQPTWDDVTDAVFARFEDAANRSPTIVATVAFGARFIHHDASRRELVFDRRALFLGMLAAGRLDRDSTLHGNTASWFVSWLTEQLPAGSIAVALSDQAMTAPERVFAAVAEGCSIVLSDSLRKLRQAAVDIARLTVNRSSFDMRHLFAAMIQLGAVTDLVSQTFKIVLTGRQIDDLKRTLVDRIMVAPGPDETAEAWQSALDLPPTEPNKQIGPLSVRRDGVPTFSPDRTAGSGDDLLDTSGDVRALARLICLDDVSPMAVAIFGGWGSGKSTFMDRLDQEVRRIAKPEAQPPGSTPAPVAGAVRFVRNVVQIRFNAWQFVDANLWASLTAEFFDQLRAGGWDRIGDSRHAELVERVNLHVHALTGDVETNRRAAIEGGKQVQQAQKARDEAAKAARAAPGGALGQSVMDALGDAYEAQKPTLAALGLSTTGTDAGKSVDVFLDVVRDSASIVGQMRSVLRVLGKLPRRTLTAGIAAAVAVLGLVLLRIFGHTLAAAAAPVILAIIAAVGTTATAVTPAVKLVLSVAKRSGDMAHTVQKANDDAVGKLLKEEMGLRKATAEAQALQDAANRSAHALARYIDPTSAANPPRLLRYVLEDDPDTKALEKEIGLIGRTRRLFQAVDSIVSTEQEQANAEKRKAGGPDRVVLYIDDLDRCTAQQVYAVLQAIHLLLAFKLFVVVVGVDVAWVQKALAREFVERPTEADDDDARRQRAIQYLEKIFQIAFWLGPLTSDGSDGGTFAKYVRALANPPPSPPPPPPPSNTDPDGTGTSNADGSLGSPLAGDPGGGERPGESDGAEQPAEPGEQQQTTPPAEALTAIQLEPREVTFLASPEIAAIAAATPRAVKRLVNVYRVVRARLGETGAAVMGDGNRPPDYPLIALCVAIETGRSVEAADAFYEGLKLLPLDEPFSESMVHGQGTGAPRLALAFDACRALQPALLKVIELRGGPLLIRDALRVARVARRYSFNVFQ